MIHRTVADLFSKQIKSYAVSTGILPAQLWGFENVTASIALAANESGSGPIGTIMFHEDGTSLPQSVAATPPPVPLVQIHLHDRHFARIVDLLRNEEPVFVTASDSFQMFFIHTAKEPVGEFETLHKKAAEHG